MRKILSPQALAALVMVGTMGLATSSSAQQLCFSDNALNLNLGINVVDVTTQANGDLVVDLTTPVVGFGGYGTLVRDGGSGVWRLAAEVKDIGTNFNWYCRWNAIPSLPDNSEAGSLCTDTVGGRTCQNVICTIKSCTPSAGGSGGDSLGAGQ